MSKIFLPTLRKKFSYGKNEKLRLGEDKQRVFTMLFLQMTVAHPAFFAQGKLFKQHRFNESYSIAADYDWTLFAWKNLKQAESIPFIVTKMVAGGISNNPSHSENIAIRKKHAPWTIKNILKNCFLRLLQQQSTIEKFMYKYFPFRLCWMFLRNIYRTVKYSVKLYKTRY